jgi:hypothetical protein
MFWKNSADYTFGAHALANAGSDYRRKGKMTPKMLDWAANGVEVFIRRRPKDGLAFATTYDYGKLITEPPLEVLRVRVPVEDIKAFEPETHPQVMAALRRHAAAPQ